MTRGGDLAWVGAASVAAAGSVAVLSVAAWGPAPTIAGWEVGTLVLDLIPVGLGWLVWRAAPGSPVAPALAWTGGSTSLVRAVEVWGGTAEGPAPWWGAGVLGPVVPGVWPWQLLGFLALVLVFPRGLLPGLRWRLVALAGPVAATMITVALAGSDDELVGPWRTPVALTGAAVLLGTLVAGVVGLVVRYRAGDATVRRQLRWLVLAAGSVPVLLAAGWAAETAGAPVAVSYVGFLVGILVLVPAAVTVAVLRHDLLDVDQLLGRTVTAVLTALLSAGVFAAVVAVAGRVLADGAGWGGTAAAFVTALCLLPLYTRVRSVVARLTDRERTVAIAAVQRFVDAVRDGSAEPEEVEDVLRRALDDDGLRLGLQLPGSPGPVGLDGAPVVPGAAGTVVLRGADTAVGVLVLGRDTARRRRLAAEAARVARLPIEVSRLRLELRGSLADVTASRARLVEAVTDERHRLERDLHDGAQQQVVAVGMRLRSLQRRLGTDPAAVQDLEQAVHGLEETVADLRRVASGLRPGRLDDGLAAALQGLVRGSPVPLRLTVEDLPPEQADETTETTAYFVVAEALANAWKHAGASAVAVTVAREGGRTRVEVADDGVGGVHPEHSLLALRDRVGSVGGELRVASPVGGGTTVTAVV